MQYPQPWWDGRAWHLDTPPRGVTPAPLAEDGWPLVPLPPQVRPARTIAVIQGSLWLVAVLFVVTDRPSAGTVTLGAVQAVLGGTLLLSALALRTLRAGPWRRVLAVEILQLAVGIAEMVALRRLAGWLLMALAVTVLVLLARPSVANAVRAASTPVPYPDVERLPRPVDPLRHWKATGREI
jgi:hypothetical protein